MGEQRSEAVAVLSAIIGWFYTICWTATFYPQPILNYRRKRTSGLSIEFILYQLTGFLCYSIYSIVTYVLQSDNSSQVDVSVAVRPNDIAFAVHALLLTLVVVVQFRWYTSTGLPVVSAVHRYILFAMWVILLFSVVLALTGSIPYYCINLSSCPFYRVNLLSLLGFAKVAVSLIKNVPQLLLNHSRRSTVGWSIHGVLLDVTGSVAAFGQQALDAWNADDGGMVWGNVPKLLLSILSFLFDVLFLLQHFVWYKRAPADAADRLQLGEDETADEADKTTVDGEQPAAMRRGGVEDDEKGAGATDYRLLQDGAINAISLPT